MGLISNGLQIRGVDVAIWGLDPSLVVPKWVRAYDFREPGDNRIFVEHADGVAVDVRPELQIDLADAHPPQAVGCREVAAQRRPGALGRCKACERQPAQLQKTPTVDSRFSHPAPIRRYSPRTASDCM